MNLSELLRTATREIHEQLHLVVDLKSMLSNRQEYAAGLVRYLAAVQPTEEWLTQAALQLSRGDLPVDFETRISKTDWLMQDLQEVSSINKAPAAKSDSFGLPFDEQYLLSQAAGVLYVTEGMTLGAMQISRSLQQDMQIEAHSGGRFFVGYGSETRSRWSEFKQWLDTAGHHEGHNNEAAIVAAKAVFRHFAEALRVPEKSAPLEGRG